MIRDEECFTRTRLKGCDYSHFARLKNKMKVAKDINEYIRKIQTMQTQSVQSAKDIEIHEVKSEEKEESDLFESVIGRVNPFLDLSQATERVKRSMKIASGLSS